MKLFLLSCITLFAVDAAAQSNYSLNFNGTSQYISIGTPLSNNTSYTKEAWVNLTTVSGNRNIISSVNAPFWINGSGLLNGGHGGNYSQVTDATTFPLNKWTHVALTYDAATTTMRLYRDGILVNTNTGVASNYTSEATYIGSHSAGSSLIQGMVDEVRIWNVARTQAQLKQNLLYPPANNASGLVSYYKLDDGSGTTATNSTGGTNGTLQNAPSWVISPSQHAGNALNFDGVDDIVSIADHASLDITTAITLEAWVYATKNTGIQNVICKSSNSPNTGYIFPRTDNGWTSTVVYLHIAGGWRTLSAPYPGLNAWHHLAATYNGATIRLYINGVEAASLAQTGSITANNNPLILGNQTGISEYFGGSADEVRVWNVARTQAQIQADMNNIFEPSLQTGLVSYFTMNQGITAGTNTGMSTVVDMKSENNGTLTGFALSGATSNFIIQNATLPLEWLSFTVQEKDRDIWLNWSTAAEENTQEFIIQHSGNGSEWKNAGRVAASGNSNVVVQYNFMHTAPFDGMNYYRILQTDRDGRESFSAVRAIRLNTADASFSVLQNPVENGMLQVRMYKPSLLSLYASDGRLLLQKQLAVGVFPVSIRHFSKGIYFLRSNRQIVRIVSK